MCLQPNARHGTLQRIMLILSLSEKFCLNISSLSDNSLNVIMTHSVKLRILGISIESSLSIILAVDMIGKLGMIDSEDTVTVQIVNNGLQI